MHDRTLWNKKDQPNIAEKQSPFLNVGFIYSFREFENIYEFVLSLPWWK